jgi:hypothetical protein
MICIQGYLVFEDVNIGAVFQRGRVQRQFAVLEAGVKMLVIWLLKMVRLELLTIDDLIAGSRCFASLLEYSVKIIYTFYISVYSILIIEQSCS